MIQLIQAAKILQDRSATREQRYQDSTLTLNINGETTKSYLGVVFGTKQDITPKPCLRSNFEIKKTVADFGSFPSVHCQRLQPKVSLTKSVISAIDFEPFINNQIFLDGDPITIDSREFDFFFYLHYLKTFIQSETELVAYLKLFVSSFQTNSWYQKSDGGWLHRLISDSSWNHLSIKAQFDCLHHEGGLNFLINEELKRYGYEPLIRAFRIKYANTSNSIVTDRDVAGKLEEWTPRTHFNDYINQLYKQQIERFKIRRKTYFNAELKEWCPFDSSFEAKKKIFLSQFRGHPEFEAKQRIIQKLIRKAENEVRVEKGYNVVGTLVNESILFSKLKKHFSGYTLVSQHRPKWLGRQSLDIYIEELKVAVEYQGEQHTRPVAFFGGTEAFEKTKQRDQKKLDRCRRNGCRLIYVYPNYNFCEVIQQITTQSNIV